MNFKCLLLSEINPSEKSTYCMIVIIWQSGKGKTTETVKKTNGYQEFVGRREDGIGETTGTR